jgi:hypothetical protein
VDFNDRFIKPNYSARLSELQGSLGAFDTAEPATAPLTLRGRVMGNGLLDVTGELRPGRPLALDVQAQASDIELAHVALRGQIRGLCNRGRAPVTKLRYRVAATRQLNASNQIILNQLSFGDRVESPDATTLPVRFAVALLKDSRGVIDDLPVSGSINDPEFSVGGIVWRLILNLIGKALTSPFALFGGGRWRPAAAQLRAGRPRGDTDRGAAAPGQAAAGPARRTPERGRLGRCRHRCRGAQAPATGRRAGGHRQGARSGAAPALPRNTWPRQGQELAGHGKGPAAGPMRAWLLARQRVDDEALRRLAVARATAGA